MTNPAVSDKFHSKLLLDVTAACLASVAGNVIALKASRSYLLVSLFQRRGTLNHWVAESLFAYCVAACRKRLSGYQMD